MSTSIAVARTDELKPGEMKRLVINGQRLLLANAEGQYYCVDEMCSHEDFSLYLGCIKDKRIKCSLHGSYFSLETGEALTDPADCPIRTYPVSVTGDQVQIHIE